MLARRATKVCCDGRRRGGLQEIFKIHKRSEAGGSSVVQRQHILGIRTHARTHAHAHTFMRACTYDMCAHACMHARRRFATAAGWTRLASLWQASAHSVNQAAFRARCIATLASEKRNHGLGNVAAHEYVQGEASDRPTDISETNFCLARLPGRIWNDEPTRPCPYAARVANFAEVQAENLPGLGVRVTGLGAGAG